MWLVLATLAVGVALGTLSALVGYSLGRREHRPPIQFTVTGPGCSAWTASAPLAPISVRRQTLQFWRDRLGS